LIVSRRVSPAHVASVGVVRALLWLRWGGIRKGIWVDLDVYVRGADALIHRELLYE
jgi:hypothetical protein